MWRSLRHHQPVSISFQPRLVRVDDGEGRVLVVVGVIGSGCGLRACGHVLVFFWKVLLLRSPFSHRVAFRRRECTHIRAALGAGLCRLGGLVVFYPSCDWKKTCVALLPLGRESQVGQHGDSASAITKILIPRSVFFMRQSHCRVRSSGVRQEGSGSSIITTSPFWMPGRWRAAQSWLTTGKVIWSDVSFINDYI